MDEYLLPTSATVQMKLTLHQQLVWSHLGEAVMSVATISLCFSPQLPSFPSTSPRGSRQRVTLRRDLRSEEPQSAGSAPLRR